MAASTALLNLTADCGVNVIRAEEAGAICALHGACLVANSETIHNRNSNEVHVPAHVAGVVSPLTALWALAAAGHPEVRP